MAKQFFSKRIPVFQTVAMLILCTVFFLLPFAGRGARLAVNDIKNNVADWLPSDYPETKDLDEFRKHFLGDSFVVISGPWCKEGDFAYENLKRELFEDSVEYERVLKAANLQEEIRARRRGDELGLMFADNWHDDWGEHREKWLLGKSGQWYFINRQGELYEWEGQNNVIQGFNRFLEKTVNGKNQANGRFIDRFGVRPTGDKKNPFYEDPTKLCGRPFKSVLTGPDAIEQMAGKNGTILVGDYSDDGLAALQAKIEAHQRLTGSLFGPTPAISFRWTYQSLLAHVDEKMLDTLNASEKFEERFEAFIKFTVKENYQEDFGNLLSATPDDKLRTWFEMWDAMELPAPKRQTCIIVTLNEPYIDELARVVGRPLFGKPRGRILELATGDCGISPQNLHIGGPPCDNVAIDEEGTKTLLRLVSLSAIIGIFLAYVSFRSIRVTCMLFFVAGVSAIASLSYVWFAGSTLDAISLSMPSLVYVLALSAAVHLVNYYRDACIQNGEKTAVEEAFKHAFFPCSLAAFTTALGLISLYKSNLVPIQKFGFFSAIAVLATVALLFTYLPSALSVWPPGYGKDKKKKEPSDKKSVSDMIGEGWSRIGDWVIGHHGLVTVLCLIAMGVAAYGLTRVETSVHLLKLFDKNAKILQDYRWMESNLGKLVPMELVVSVDKESQKEQWLAELEKSRPQVELKEGETPPPLEYDRMEYDLKYSLLERIELSLRIRTQLEKFFGPQSQDIVGRGMSADVVIPYQNISTDVETENALDSRRAFNNQLRAKRDQLLEQDYLAVDDQTGAELWRISLRLAALNDVDYGEFINDIKTVVEPIMTAYSMRTQILRELQKSMGEESLQKAGILVLGPDPNKKDEKDFQIVSGESFTASVDQTYIFSDTLRALFENRGFTTLAKKDKNDKKYGWVNTDEFFAFGGQEIEGKKEFLEEAKFVELIKRFDCVVITEDSPLFDYDLVRNNAKMLVDAREHHYRLGEKKGVIPSTAMDRKKSGTNVDVATIYTGIIPIVYKSQRALLHSLIESICLAFVMIAFVMMLLLRNWRERISLSNSLNVTGGMISMIPNVFPVVVIFGAMGLLMIKVDIGSMMTASVAMGVAVDDTIHYLNWYRKGLSLGLTRKASIKMAYDRVATAMTQTTLIGGFGLAAFAFSTFTPTQRFGVLMLILLGAALVGDLILLPALLAGPLGRFFGKEKEGAKETLDLPPNELETALDDDSMELRVVDGEVAAEKMYDVHPDSFKHLEDPKDRNVADG